MTAQQDVKPQNWNQPFPNWRMCMSSSF